MNDNKPTATTVVMQAPLSMKVSAIISALAAFFSMRTALGSTRVSGIGWNPNGSRSLTRPTLNT